MTRKSTPLVERLLTVGEAAELLGTTERFPRRRFGRVRRLPSGRYQARYLGPDGLDRPAPGTFASKTSAEKWLVRKEAEIHDDQKKDTSAAGGASCSTPASVPHRWPSPTGCSRQS